MKPLNLTKTQRKCLDKCVAFEKCNKDTLQNNVNSYKCLSGFKVISARKRKTASTIILMKHLGNGTYHHVRLVVTHSSEFEKILK